MYSQAGLSVFVSLSHRKKIILVGILLYRDKSLYRVCFIPVLCISVSENGKHYRTDKVHKQIGHGINKANIQITAYAQRLSVDIDLGDSIDFIWNSTAACFQQHRRNRVDDSILLHVQAKNHVHGELEKLP